MLSMTELKDE